MGNIYMKTERPTKTILSMEDNNVLLLQVFTTNRKFPHFLSTSFNNYLLFLKYFQDLKYQKHLHFSTTRKENIGTSTFSIVAKKKLKTVSWWLTDMHNKLFTVINFPQRVPYSRNPYVNTYYELFQVVSYICWNISKMMTATILILDLKIVRQNNRAYRKKIYGCYAPFKPLPAIFGCRGWGGGSGKVWNRIKFCAIFPFFNKKTLICRSFSI